jgi:hypothetical protein
MCRDHSSSHDHQGSPHHETTDDHHHHHDDGHHVHHHPHDVPDEKAASVSTKAKLLTRLEHHIRHNQEHADFYRKLAGEAAGLGVMEAARLILVAAEDTDCQNQNLEKALSLMRH